MNHRMRSDTTQFMREISTDDSWNLFWGLKIGRQGRNTLFI